LLASALVGAFGAIAAQIVAQLLARGREGRRFALESFQRFRSEFDEDAELRRIDAKEESLTDEETERILGFFEEVGLYADKGLVDEEMVDEILGTTSSIYSRMMR